MNRIVWTFNEICSDTSVVIITLIRMVGLKLNREKTTKTTAATRPLEKFSSSFDETYEMVECQMQFVRCQFSCRNFSIKYICMLFPCLSACKLRRTNESIYVVRHDILAFSILGQQNNRYKYKSVSYICLAARIFSNWKVFVHPNHWLML